MRRALLVHTRNKGRSLVRRTRLLDHVKDDKIMKEEEIPSAESQDQVRGLISSSKYFNLADLEEFDRLRESMAEVKSMFMETKKEILGLKQIMNIQHVDEDNHTSSDHVDHVINVPHDRTSDSGDGSFSKIVEHSEKEDDGCIDLDEFQKRLQLISSKDSPLEERGLPNKIEDAIHEIDDGFEEDRQVITPEVITQALERVQMLKAENEVAVSRLRKMESNLFKDMEEIEEIEKSMPAATHDHNNHLRSLKSSLEKDKAWVEKNLNNLKAQIKVFEDELRTPLASWLYKSNLISKVLPAVLEEQVQMLKMANEEANSMLCEIEIKLLKAIEEIEQLKAAPLGDEVETLIVNVVRLKVDIDDTLEKRDNWMKNMSFGNGEYRRRILMHRFGVCEQESKISKALEESEKLGAVAPKTLQSCQGMLKKMKERLDQELDHLGGPIEVLKTIYRRRRRN